MKNIGENQNMEGPRPDIRSSLAGVGGHGSSREKRASVVEIYDKLKKIIAILPEDSKKRLGRQAELIRKNPEEAIEIIRTELEASREILNLLDNPISTDEALEQLDELLPKETTQ